MEGQPAFILDAFHVSNANCATDLIVVVGLDNGQLRAYRSGEIHLLPEALQRQLRAALVSKRGTVRTLQVSQLFLLTLDSIEQREMSGLNDAVLLFGQACACVECLLDGWEISSLAQPGALTVGRLDVLQGFVLGFEHVWRNPESSGDFLSHLFLPAGILAELRRGQSLALVYPLFETETTSVPHNIDNTSFVLRIVYDLLLKLQEEWIRAGHKDSFGGAVLPVPSRRRLEYELAADGYEIRGDEAVRVGTANPSIDMDWLQRLQRWAAIWNAPHIPLPPQARPRDYRNLATQALALAADESDRATMAALEQHLRPSLAIQENQSKPETRVTQAYKPSYEITPRFEETLTQPVPPITSTSPVRGAKGEDWSTDFGEANPRQQPNRDNSEDWSNDFATDTN